MRLFTLVILKILLINTIEGSRILAVLPITHSHYRFCRKIVAILAESGHDIVAIIPMADGKMHATVTEIPMGFKTLNEVTNVAQSKMEDDPTFFESQRQVWTMMNTFTDRLILNFTSTVKNFVETDNSHFDLVIVEEFFIQAFYGFAHKYKAPLVLISTFGAAHYINDYTGNALETSYVAHEFSDMFTVSTLYLRARNLIYTIFDVIGRKVISLEDQNRIAQLLFRDPTMPHVSDLERNAAVVFLNNHFSMSLNQPLLSNMIQIGGLHIEEAKPLDPNIKQILDNATDGAVIFSLGSVLDISHQLHEKVNGILNALGRLKQTVFIKYSSAEPLTARFNNIYNVEWLPQNDMLAHPNTIAFVTHGGLNSAQEAVHHGVPVVCIPFYGDQPSNCLKSEALGYGVVLKKSDLNEENLYQKLNEVISNSKYKMAARQMSKRFRDRPLSPKDQVIYWTEYVLRHNGSDFMKGPKRNLYWYQILYLDLFALVVLAFLLLKYLISKLIKAILSNKNWTLKSKVKKK